MKVTIEKTFGPAPNLDLDTFVLSRDDGNRFLVFSRRNTMGDKKFMTVYSIDYRLEASYDLPDTYTFPIFEFKIRNIKHPNPWMSCHGEKYYRGHFLQVWTDDLKDIIQMLEQNIGF